MSGRAATACALYSAFLGAWALAAALRRRGDAGAYLPLGIVLLEAILLVGAAVSLAGGLSGPEPAVHAGYLLASVAIAPIGWLLAATGDRRHDPLTLTVAMAVLTVVVLRVDATA